MTSTTVARGEALISYSHKNKAVAVAIQEALEAHGWRTFRDETSIEAGDSLTPELADAIDRADLFVAVVSSDYVASKVCMWELTQAVDRKFTDDPGRLVPLKLGTVKMPKILKGVKYVKVAAGEEAVAVDAVLRDRRFTDQVTNAARPVGETLATPPAVPVSGPETGAEVARVAVRYARELERLAEIDTVLVEIQLRIESAARSYDEAAYQAAWELWQNVWAGKTSTVTSTELLDRIQVIGSLLSEVVLSDRTPKEVRPWMVQRAVINARASVGFTMRGEELPETTFPGTAELRVLLGRGDGEDDPIGPLRARLADFPTPRFHPAPLNEG